MPAASAAVSGTDAAGAGTGKKGGWPSPASSVWPSAVTVALQPQQPQQQQQSPQQQQMQAATGSSHQSKSPSQPQSQTQGATPGSSNLSQATASASHSPYLAAAAGLDLSALQQLQQQPQQQQPGRNGRSLDNFSLDTPTLSGHRIFALSYTPYSNTGEGKAEMTDADPAAGRDGTGSPPMSPALQKLLTKYSGLTAHALSPTVKSTAAPSTAPQSSDSESDRKHRMATSSALQSASRIAASSGASGQGNIVSSSALLSTPPRRKVSATDSAGLNCTDVMGGSRSGANASVNPSVSTGLGTSPNQTNASVAPTGPYTATYTTIYPNHYNNGKNTDRTGSPSTLANTAGATTAANPALLATVATSAEATVMMLWHELARKLESSQRQLDAAWRRRVSDQTRLTEQARVQAQQHLAAAREWERLFQQ